MFMIHTPQTIQLYGLKPAPVDGKPADEPPVCEGTITFQHETDDVSKCQMIVSIEDRVYTFTFGTRGPIVETSYEDDKTREAKAAAEKEAHEAELKRQQDEQEAAKVSHDHELRTEADTTEKDVAWDAPHLPAPSGFGATSPRQTDPGPNPFERPIGQARNPMMEKQNG